MIHLTVSASRGGIMLTPHFLNPHTTMTEATPVDMLQTDASPQIAAVMPEGKQ